LPVNINNNYSKEMEKKNKFNLRSFTSFSLVISTIIMSWSGFILYIAPPGRIANWGTWRLMLFTKTEWQALHTIFSYLFFILFIIHLFFVNWKAFLTYFRSKIRAGLNRKWELIAASLMSTVFFIGTLRSWTPFEPVMAFGEKVKESWEGDFQSPPVLHMEIYTIEQLAALLDSIPPPEVIRILRENNIKIENSDETLKDIAGNNNTTPSAIYDILTANSNKQIGPVEGGAPQGVGKYTVKLTAERTGKDLNSLIMILKEKGVEANGETTLRAIADQIGISPHDVYEFLSKSN
jgi:hypothetical protein